MFEYCSDPSTLDTFRWFGCYLTNGAHFLFYQSFLVVFALLAVTAPAALAFGFAAAAASRSHILPLSWLGKAYTAMVRGVPDIVFFLFFILALDQAIEYLRHSVVCPDWTEDRSGRARISSSAPRRQLPQSGAPQWVHETYGFASRSSPIAIVFGAFCGNVLYGAMRAVPRPQLETAEAYGMTRRQVFWRILVPQMWIYALPGLSNIWMILIKATPLLFLLGIEDIVYWARELGGSAPRPTSTRTPTGGFWYFFGLLVFYLAFTRVSEIVLVADHGAAVARTGHGGGRRDAEGGGMTCAEAIQAYAFRAIGFGERLLPRTDIGVCEQVVLIGSGMIWNIYFAVLALGLGFFFAVVLGGGQGLPQPRASQTRGVVHLRLPGLAALHPVLHGLRGLRPPAPHRRGIRALRRRDRGRDRWFARAWLGALIVLWLNTSAYSAEIFYGALRSCPRAISRPPTPTG
jgi:polar amino acid transport system permease protein